MTEETQAGRDPTDTLVEKDGPLCRASPEDSPNPRPLKPKHLDSIAHQAKGTMIRRNAGHHPPDDVNYQRHSRDDIKFRGLCLKPNTRHGRHKQAGGDHKTNNVMTMSQENTADPDSMGRTRQDGRGKHTESVKNVTLCHCMK
jgi:hypothetical protein